MNIFRKVTLQTMRHNRVRTLVTIIGIILSAAMFTAVTTFCSSLFHFLKITSIYESGNYHLAIKSVSGEQLQAISSDSRTKTASFAEYLGYAEIPSENSGKPYLYVAAANDTFFEEMPVHLTSGRLPENSAELLLPEHLSANGKVSYSSGERLTLTLGDRVAEDGFSLTQHNPYSEEEAPLTARTEKTYTVVGFYERPEFESYYAPGYTALTKADGARGAGSVFDVYVLLKKPRQNLDAFMIEHVGVSGYSCNYDVLMFSGILLYSNIAVAIFSLAAIFCAMIFAGSVSLIYSAFSISVSERTRQFGLLSSVGATKKQLRKSVFTEAFTVSAVGIPLGILSGILGMGVTLYLCGGMFQSMFRSPFSLTLSVSPLSVVLAAAIALATVLVSAFIPSKRAMKITAIEAIRQNKDIKAANSAVRYSRLFYRTFGVEGVLAKKYYRRSRKKYRTTILSLAMSVILFISASAFGMYLTQTVDESIQVSDFDLIYYSNATCEKAGALHTLLSGVPGITDFSVCSNPSTLKGLIYEQAADSYLNYQTALYNYKGRTIDVIDNIRLCYIDDASFDRLLAENGLKKEDYYNPAAPKALVLNHSSDTIYQRTGEDNYARVTYSFDFLRDGTSSLTTVSFPETPEGYWAKGLYWSGETGEGELAAYYLPEGADYTDDLYGRPENAMQLPPVYTELSIGAFLKSAPIGSGGASRFLQLFYPMSLLEEADSIPMFAYLTSDTPKETLSALKAALEESGFSSADSDFYDPSEDEAQMRNIVTLVNVFSYGFIVLISLISVANVFNTISTNVALRRRDYAMLRSIGMTDRGLSAMMNYECILYGTRALLLGLPLALCLTFLIYRSVRSMLSIGFSLPWSAILIAILCVFLVVFVTMLYSMGKIKKDNPIDALKNENI